MEKVAVDELIAGALLVFLGAILGPLFTSLYAKLASKTKLSVSQSSHVLCGSEYMAIVEQRFRKYESEYKETLTTSDVSKSYESFEALKERLSGRFGNLLKENKVSTKFVAQNSGKEHLRADFDFNIDGIVVEEGDHTFVKKGTRKSFDILAGQQLQFRFIRDTVCEDAEGLWFHAHLDEAMCSVNGKVVPCRPTLTWSKKDTTNLLKFFSKRPNLHFFVVFFAIIWLISTVTEISSFIWFSDNNDTPAVEDSSPPASDPSPHQ